MADLSDVSDALVSFVSGVAYPGGTDQPSAFEFDYGDRIGVISPDISVFGGWPQPSQLDRDLAANKVNVSVFPRPEEHNLALLQGDSDEDDVEPTPTLQLTLNGLQVTVAGTVSAKQNLCVFTNRKPYTYQTVGNETLAQIASALAALIAVDVPSTSSSGAVITLGPIAYGISVRVGTSATVQVEVGRQSRLFQVTVWANRYDVRDAIGKALDAALSGQAGDHGQPTALRLTLADGSTAIVRYQRSAQGDEVQKQQIYRRDLFYAIEFAKTQADVLTQIVATQENVSPQNAGQNAPTVTVYE